MFKHLSSEHHTRKYLTVKFGYAKKSNANLEEAINIAEFEGKIIDILQILETSFQIK